MMRTWLFLIAFSIFSSSTARSDSETENLNPADQVLSLKTYFSDQALYSLMSVVTTNLLKREENSYKTETYDCINRADNVNAYAKCIGHLLAKNLKLKHLFKSKNDKKKYALQARFERGTDNKVSEVEPPSLAQELAYFFSSVVKNVKQKSGSLFNISNVFDKRRLNIYSNSDSDSAGTPSPIEVEERANSVRKFIENFIKSPLMMFKDSFTSYTDSNMFEPNPNIVPNDEENESGMRILSPRLIPLVKDSKERFLSPDFFAMFEGGSDNIASIPSLLSGLDEKDRDAWISFFRELTGLNDLSAFLQSPEFAEMYRTFQSSHQTSRTLNRAVTVNETLRTLGSATVESVIKSLSQVQFQKLNQSGYTFLNNRQLSDIYKDDFEHLPFDVGNYETKDDEERESLLYEELLLMTATDHHSTDGQHGRVKRDTANTTILAPYLGGTVLTTSLLAPTVLSPSVFSYVILGPIVLSPFILSPYVFAPFILSPEVLVPFILNPSVFAPNILNPGILSPSILSPYVLSPYILSPFSLSPSILSPSLLSPFILSPGVLNPSILSPGVLNPAILSDSALSPAILSPCVLC